MATETRRLNIIVLLLLLFSSILVLLLGNSAYPAYFTLRGENSQPVLSYDYDNFPQETIDEAIRIATGLYGSRQESVNELVSQLIGTLIACQDHDMLVIFNAGGFGWDSVEDASGWVTIMDGITDTLSDLGYHPLIMDYRRTHSNLEGIIGESIAFWGIHPLKAKELAARIDFITSNRPDMKIIITGESNGAAIVEETFCYLIDNSNVYSIQTGPTPVQSTTEHERSLVLRHNGLIADSFSQGDVFTIFRSNLEALFGINQQYPGDIMFYIGAPGHYYSWEYQGLQDKVNDFLLASFFQ